jgi:HTH-type transcriptional regulator/antitoxin HigA
VDFDSISGENESKADRMAKDFLIDSVAYKKFLRDKKYISSKGIGEFAEQQNVRDYIVQGRLMKEEIIPWKARPKYDWA